MELVSYLVGWLVG